MNFKLLSRRCHGSRLSSGISPDADAVCVDISVKDFKSYMLSAREAIATTSLVGVRDIEKGLWGNLIVVGGEVPSSPVGLV